MKVAIDLYPMMFRPTGIGQYTAHLVAGLAEQPEIESLGGYAVAWNLPATSPALPDRVEMHKIRLPGRLVWKRAIKGALSFAAPGWDVAHLTNYRPLPAKARAVVVTVYDIIFDVLPDTFPPEAISRYRDDLRRCLRLADRVVAISKTTRNDLVSHFGLAEADIDVVYPAIDLHNVAPRPSPEAVQEIRRRYRIDRPYLLYLGTIESRKNLVRLIKAYNVIGAMEGYGLQLVMAGRMGHDSDKVSQTIDELKLNGLVVMTGYVKDEDKKALLACALAFVYPSLYEGFGIPVLEAMAMGVPVLASAGSALSEAADGAAVTVDPTSEEQLADGLSRIVRDRSLRRRLIDAGLERAGSFTPGAMARAMIDVYRKLV